MNITEQLITKHEGVEAKPYQDSKGIWTVGIGHNLEANSLPVGICADAPNGLPWPDCLGFLQRRGGLKPTEIDALFQHDIQADCGWLEAKPWWAQLNEARQAAANDLAFNLGMHVAQEFTTFWGLFAVGDWIAAANDLGANPKLVAEEPKRIANLQQIIRTGSVAGILTEAS